MYVEYTKIIHVIADVPGRREATSDVIDMAAQKGGYMSTRENQEAGGEQGRIKLKYADDRLDFNRLSFAQAGQVQMAKPTMADIKAIPKDPGTDPMKPLLRDLKAVPKEFFKDPPKDSKSPPP